MADLKMEAAIIFEPFLPNALQRALEYAGDDDNLYGYDAESRRTMCRRV